MNTIKKGIIDEVTGMFIPLLVGLGSINVLFPNVAKLCAENFSGNIIFFLFLFSIVYFLLPVILFYIWFFWVYSYKLPTLHKNEIKPINKFYFRLNLIVVVYTIGFFLWQFYIEDGLRFNIDSSIGFWKIIVIMLLSISAVILMYVLYLILFQIPNRYSFTWPQRLPAAILLGILFVLPFFFFNKPNVKSFTRIKELNTILENTSTLDSILNKLETDKKIKYESYFLAGRVATDKLNYDTLKFKNRFKYPNSVDLLASYGKLELDTLNSLIEDVNAAFLSYEAVLSASLENFEHNDSSFLKAGRIYYEFIEFLPYAQRIVFELNEKTKKYLWYVIKRIRITGIIIFLAQLTLFAFYLLSISHSKIYENELQIFEASKVDQKKPGKTLSKFLDLTSNIRFLVALIILLFIPLIKSPEKKDIDISKPSNIFTYGNWYLPSLIENQRIEKEKIREKTKELENYNDDFEKISKEVKEVKDGLINIGKEISSIDTTVKKLDTIPKTIKNIKTNSDSIIDLENTTLKTLKNGKID